MCSSDTDISQQFRNRAMWGCGVYNMKRQNLIIDDKVLTCM